MPNDTGEQPGVHTVFAPDHLSTLTTRELQALMRESPTLPAEALLNRGGVAIDYDNRRILRDSYWKGSFARDNLLGWEERLATPIRPDRAAYTGGRFWKRFDEVRGGDVFGHVINYGLAFLPGRPRVHQQPYPDGARRYMRPGDDALLLSYLNHPYRIVYDLIKMVDANNCIGVMHLGSFPRGREFATFVLARNNYPFEKMAVPDHDAIFGGDRVRVPAVPELEGSWTGYLVFLRHPETALHNQFNPPLLRFDFTPAGTTPGVRMQFALASSNRSVRLDADCVRLVGDASTTEELRQIDPETLVGRRVRTGSGEVLRRYVLRRRG
jgi:hypothetical protein